LAINITSKLSILWRIISIFYVFFTIYQFEVRFVRIDKCYFEEFFFLCSIINYFKKIKKMKTFFKTLFVVCFMICLSQISFGQKTASNKQKIALFSREGVTVKLTYNSDSTTVLKVSYLENKVWSDYELLDYAVVQEGNGFIYNLKKKDGKLFTAEFMRMDDALFLFDIAKDNGIALFRTN